VCVGVALDVMKAFPSVVVAVMMEEVRRRRLPEEVVEWVRSFMEGKTRCLYFEGIVSNPIEWRSGLPQGSPLSPILFLLYNSLLLEFCRFIVFMARGWLDNVNLLAWSTMVEEALSSAQKVVPNSSPTPLRLNGVDLAFSPSPWLAPSSTLASPSIPTSQPASVTPPLTSLAVSFSVRIEPAQN
jgi:hypothetical protein